MKKIRALMMVILLMLGSIMPISAASVTITKEPTGVVVTGDAEAKNSSGYRMWWSAGHEWKKVYANGVLSFCIEPERLLIATDGYTVSDFNDAEREMFSRIIYHGYEVNPTGENYVLTQWTLWTYIDSIREDLTLAGTENLGLVNFQVRSDEIIQKALNHGRTVSFDNQTVNLNVGESMTLTDTNGILATSTLVSSDNLGVVVNGNILTITATDKSLTSAKVRFKKYGDLSATTAIAPILYAHPTSQDMIVGGNPDPVVFSVNVSVNFNGTLVVNKSDNQSQKVNNAVFRLSRNPDMSEVVNDFSTNENGQFIVPNLTLGTYYLQEQSVPSPLIMDTEIISVTIKAGQTTTINRTNQNAQGQVEILKSGPLNEPIKNVSFEIRNGSHQLVDSVVTGIDGKTISKLLPLGTYTIKETSVPAPYILDPIVSSITLSYIDSNTPIVTQLVKRVNSQAEGQLSIRKIDQETSEPLANATFEIKDGSKRVVDTLVTDNQGVATSRLLPLGDYTVTEIIAPEGYVLDQTQHEVSLTYLNFSTALVSTSITIPNSKIMGQIRIHKVDSYFKDQPIAKVGFEILRWPTNELVQRVDTDENGEALSMMLPYGDYVLKEVSTPLSYYQATADSFVSIRDNNSIIDKEIVNDPVLLKVKIKKLDGENSLPLAGVRYAILDENEKVMTLIGSNELAILTTNIQGEALSSGYLPYGSYILREIATLPGYVRGQDTFFEVTREITGETLEFDFTNQKTQVSISKLDAYSKPLINAELAIFKEDTLIEEWISTATPHIVTGLVVGQDYVVKELEAPMGYQLAPPLLITVADTPSVQEYTLVDEEIPTIETFATFENGLKMNVPSNDTTIKDEVKLARLTPNRKYLLMGELIDLNTKKALNTKKIEFEAQSDATMLEMDFKIDASGLDGHQLVVTQHLYQSGRLVAKHAALDDIKQMVSFPRLTSVVQDKQIHATKQAVVTDVVTCSGFLSEREMILTGQVQDKETLEVVSQVEKILLPNTCPGDIEVKYEFDASHLPGAKLVIVAEVTQDGHLIASHNDLDDPQQSFEVMASTIQTQAKAMPYQKDNELWISDLVSYDQLIKGKEYTIVGTLMSKQNNLPLLVNGESVVSIVHFRPNSEKGEILVDFKFFDAIEKGEIVVFERLYVDEDLIGSHIDISDPKQTIHFKEIIICKTDVDNGNGLSGVEFTLNDGYKIIKSGITDEHGQLKWVVAPGLYQLEETKSLDGYLPKTDRIEIDLENNHEALIHISNQKIPQLPDTSNELPVTGQRAWQDYAIVGAVLGCLGVVLLRRKNHN